MNTPNDTVYIYVLQRISDKAYLYIGSAKNPKERFSHHAYGNPYPVIQEAFANKDIRFLVITSTDEEHRIEIEAQLWQQFKDAGHPIANNKPHAWGTYADRRLSEETRRKISEANKGKIITEEQRRQISETLTGNTVSNEIRAKISATMTGRVFSDTHRANLSKAMEGRPCHENTRIAVSKAHKGIPLSNETKAKMSATTKGRKGKPLTEEAKAKISAANKLRGPVSQETRRKLSEAHKGKVKSPEWIANIVAAKARKKKERESV